MSTADKRKKPSNLPNIQPYGVQKRKESTKMNETKSESFHSAQPCDNKPTDAIRNHTLTLEALLKDIYNNHKETIRLCREEQKEKFTKIVTLKNKMFERGKEIQRECNALKKENQDLKEALSSRTDVPCKICDHLRHSFDSLEEAYKRSLSEKDKMIKYLEAQLNGQQPTLNSDPDNVSPKSSPDNQKNNRLRLKTSQKRVIYKESAEENPEQILPSNVKPSPAAPLMNVPETCLPDTCAADNATVKKSAETDNELTVVPDTLALFNPWDSDEQPSIERKKFSRCYRNKENQEESCVVDADQTLPPENWGNETLMNDSDVNHMEKMTVCSNGDDQIWHTAQPPDPEHEVINPNKTDQQMTEKNGSLAPDMHMTQFLEENEIVDGQTNRNEPSEDSSEKTTTDLEEVDSCSQIFPSRSYKFSTGKRSALKEAEKNVAAEAEYEPTHETVCDSFDNVPHKEEINYAHHSVVRKKGERQKLNGYTCRQCVEYYQAKGLSEEEIRHQVGDCSRHRAKYVPPQTPEHFWSVDFPDTVECEKRGYFTRDEPGLPTRRKLQRRKRLQQLNTVKGEKDKKQKSETDEQIGMTQMLEYLSAESCNED
ncbi:RBBP8 [Acanthosepion pharaonis]|uniref:RBBP8 n=1 Tax=Acanthosepion pharaonis TaxID=158019 RepID=A0A812BDJ3_ACAPH|nr:RBBP8 [Sepia pharaonis]